MVTSALDAGEHFARINGFTVHYLVRGTGPVLLVPAPGWGPSVNYLVPLPGLEDDCTVVYFDTRHSGRSTGPEDPSQYSLDHLVADIEALRNHLGADHIFLAGHSGGGHQVLEYGIRHSDRVAGIIAINALVNADKVRRAELRRRLTAMRDKPFYRTHPETYERGLAVQLDEVDYELTIAEKLDATGGFYFSDPELASGAFDSRQYNDDLLRYSRASRFQSKNLLPELGLITVPTLLVYGADDFQCDPITQGERAHAVMTNSQLTVIANAGHRPWVEQPAAFAAACRHWLEQFDL
jgi:proline iminopeptidase